MDKRKQFMIIDLTIFSILAMLTELGSRLLLNSFPTAGFTFSFSLLLGLIAIYRWGLKGCIVFIVSGIPMIFLEGSIGVNLLFYPVANSFIVFSVFVYRYLDKTAIKTNLLKSLMFVVIPVAFISIGKGLVILTLDHHMYGFIDYFASQLLTITITFIVLNLVVHLEGLLEDMNNYIED